MLFNLTVIKADVGSIAGHVIPSKPLLETIGRHVAAETGGLLRDCTIGVTCDDIVRRPGAQPMTPPDPDDFWDDDDFDDDFDDHESAQAQGPLHGALADVIEGRGRLVEDEDGQLLQEKCARWPSAVAGRPTDYLRAPLEGHRSRWATA